jgi:hypothetical protein
MGDSVYEETKLRVVVIFWGERKNAAANTANSSSY